MVSFTESNAALSRRVPATSDKDQTSVSSESTNVLFTSRKVKLSMITHTTSRPRQGVKHLTVLAVFVVMCLSAAHGAKMGGPRRDHGGVELHSVELLQPTRGRENSISIADGEPGVPDILEEKVECPKCGFKIKKGDVQRVLEENYWLRYLWKKQTVKYDKQNDPFFHDKHIGPIVDEMEKRNDKKFAQFKIDSLGDKSCGRWDSKRERPYVGIQCKLPTKCFNMFPRDQKRDTFKCPNCQCELVIGDDYTLTKKIWDRMFTTMGLAFAPIVTGFCFAGYIMDLRSAENISDSYGVHLILVLSVSMMLFFLLRGHGWNDGNDATKWFKILGLVSGLGSAITAVFALGATENTAIGAVAPDGTTHVVQDLNFTEMYNAQSDLFFIAIVAGILALFCILLVNYKANIVQRDGGGNNRWDLGGTFLLNFCLVGASFGGLMSFADAMGRMGAEGSSVEWGSYIGIGLCAVYVIFYVWWKSMYKKAHWAAQFFTVTGAAGTVFCLLSYLSFSQNGLSQMAAEDEGMCQLAMWLGVLFFVMMLLGALKVQGTQFNVCKRLFGKDANAAGHEL